MSRLRSPAECVAEAYGGDAHVAVALSRQGETLTADAVRKWRAPRDKGGGGGQVPSKYLPLLLRDAREQRIDLSAEALIAGCEAPAAESVP